NTIMKITHDGSKDLDTYYEEKPDLVHPCQPSDKIDWLCLSPYDRKETFYYILRMLLLPGGFAALIIFGALFGLYNNLIIQQLSFGLTYIGTLLISIYYWERGRENRFAIPESEVLKPGIFPLNPIKKPILSIGFVGDMMMMRKFLLTIDTPIKNFFRGVDFIVGNLEGIIINKKPFLTQQAHPEEILTPLASLLTNKSKWLLCVSNNHSIDFGNNKFNDSIKIIQNPNKPENQKKFIAFGRNDVHSAFINDKFSISTGTKWSNQKNWKCIPKFGNSEQDHYYNDGKFNILYPHWGYENERYVRSSIQDKGRELLTAGEKKWGLIFGHHPHVRQPVMIVKDKLMKPNGTPLKGLDGNNIVIKKLVAFSGGNFTSGVNFLRKKKHIHGIIMRCEIGHLINDPNQIAVGVVKLQNSFNEKVPNSQQKTKIVKIGDGIAGRSRSYYVILGILLLVTVILLKLLELFW
ncbi:MAG: CapA family protein, partial [Promethearchaeota archaeon]